MIWEWRERMSPRYWEAAAVIVSVAGLGYGIDSGEKARASQRRGQSRQDATQKQAQTAASRQQKLSAEAYAAANRRKPDVGSILATEAELARAGSSTTLTGPSGVRGQTPGQLPKLLGE